MTGSHWGLQPYSCTTEPLQTSSHPQPLHVVCTSTTEKLVITLWASRRWIKYKLFVDTYQKQRNDINVSNLDCMSLILTLLIRKVKWLLQSCLFLLSNLKQLHQSHNLQKEMYLNTITLVFRKLQILMMKKKKFLENYVQRYEHIKVHKF